MHETYLPVFWYGCFNFGCRNYTRAKSLKWTSSLHAHKTFMTMDGEISLLRLTASNRISGKTPWDTFTRPCPLHYTCTTICLSSPSMGPSSLRCVLQDLDTRPVRFRSWVKRTTSTTVVSLRKLDATTTLIS